MFYEYEIWLLKYDDITQVEVCELFIYKKTDWKLANYKITKVSYNSREQLNVCSMYKQFLKCLLDELVHSS